MIDIEKESKFLKNIKNNDSIDKLIKQKKNLSNLLKIILKEINNEIDIDTLDNLDDSQMWAFIYNNSSESINNYKNKTKNFQDILNELIETINTKENTDSKKLGKKTKRIKDNNNKDNEDNLEENEEIEDEENEEKEFNEENEENEEIDDEEYEEEDDEDENMNKILKKGDKDSNPDKKDKDIFFSMKDLNNFADQFEEEDNNNLKSAPNKLKLSSSRNTKNKTKEKEENENEDEEIEDENNSLYSEEQEVKAEIDSEEEIKFDKFFDKPTKKSKNLENSSENSDIDENEIFNQIKEIEQKMISNKKEWSTRGEILGKERPKDSLLTKAMDFEVGLKAPPIPDREYTDKLESMIKQRIKDDLFDDPIKKQIINLNENKKPNDNELNFDKSKKGLGEIYEEKYLGNEKTETKIDEIKKDCDDLCNKLFDIFKQMTNGTANPYGIKGKKEDIANISNMPAIQIEELGNFLSDNKDMIKSGKEIFNPNKIRNKNKEEMTPEELRNIHNRKKRNIKNRIHQKEQKRKLNELTQQLGSKFEAKIKMKQEKDKKMQKMDKSNTTEYKSTKFFGKINEMAEKDNEKKKKKV